MPITISNVVVAANAPTGTIVGALTATDMAGALVPCNFITTKRAGGYFAISDNNLVTSWSGSITPGYYSVKVRANGINTRFSASATFAIYVTASDRSPPIPDAITFSSILASLPDNTVAGTAVATFSVAMSDGSAFSGTLTASPADIVAISDNTRLVLARSLNSADDGPQQWVVNATQNGVTISGSVQVQVTAVASPPPPPPAPPPPAVGTNFIISTAPGSVRNDFTGFVGMEITVTANPLVVASLGRFVIAGNAQPHTVQIIGVSTGNVVGSVTVNTSGQTAGQFSYATLAAPVTLAAGSTYYVVSQETAGGDQWYDIISVTGRADATINGAAYFTNNAWFINGAGANHAYVPVDFTYTGGVTTPPPAPPPPPPSSQQTIVSVVPTSAGFTGGTGSANSVIATVSATMSPASPAFAGTWLLSGANASLFTIKASTGVLSVASSDVAAGTYALEGVRSGLLSIISIPILRSCRHSVVVLVRGATRRAHWRGACGL